jgi:hypothetical protein
LLKARYLPRLRLPQCKVSTFNSQLDDWQVAVAKRGKLSWPTLCMVDASTLKVRITTAINSFCVSGSGLACILLAFAAFSATQGKSASVTPPCAEPRDAEFGGECPYPLDAILYACFTPAGKQTRDGRVAFESRMLWCTGAQSSYVGRPCRVATARRRALRAEPSIGLRAVP